MSCAACFKGTQHQHGTPKGEITTIHGVETYVTPPQATAVSSQSVIIYICDGFGLDLVNNRLLADDYAEGTGMRVFIPAFPSKPLPVWALASMDILEKPVDLTDLWAQWRRLKNIAWAASVAIPFMLWYSPSKEYPAILDFVRKVKADTSGKLGVCGFCWGGYCSTKLCTEPVIEGGSEPLVQAQFTAHPSMLKVPDMILDAVKTYKTPYSLTVGDKEILLTPSKALDIEAQLTKANEEGAGYVFEFTIIKGVGHGFSVRGDSKEPVVKAAIEEAKTQAISWFKKYL